MIDWLKNFFLKKETLSFERNFQTNHLVHRKIKDWQNREAPIWEGYKDIPLNIGLASVKELHKNLLYHFSVEQDVFGDYWKTSKESMDDMTGDCEDFAILLWSILRRNGFDIKTIGMVIIPRHCFAFYQPYWLEDDFYVLDNGFITKEIVKASELFPIKQGNEILLPVLGFNLEEWWTYNIRGGK